MFLLRASALRSCPAPCSTSPKGRRLRQSSLPVQQLWCVLGAVAWPGSVRLSVLLTERPLAYPPQSKKRKKDKKDKKEKEKKEKKDKVRNSHGFDSMHLACSQLRRKLAGGEQPCAAVLGSRGPTPIFCLRFESRAKCRACALL